MKTFLDAKGAEYCIHDSQKFALKKLREVPKVGYQFFVVLLPSNGWNDIPISADTYTRLRNWLIDCD